MHLIFIPHAGCCSGSDGSVETTGSRSCRESEPVVCMTPYPQEREGGSLQIGLSDCTKGKKKQQRGEGGETTRRH